MSNDNKVQLDVELDIGDSTLRDAQRKFEDLAKKYEEAFKSRRSAMAKGGRFSPAFLISDEELKRAGKNAESARDHVLKLQTEYEQRSKPFIQRAGGLVHRMLFGENVGSGDDADKEQRKIAARIGVFQRSLHGTLALSANVSRALAPLPGGGVLHTALAGAAGGFSAGMVDPNTGQARGGLLGAAGGLLGGLKGMAANAGMALLAKGVGGAVTGGRRDERLMYSLSRSAGGDTALGREGLRLAQSQAGLSDEEAAQTIGGSFRAGGGATSARQALRAQVTAGLGGEFNQLLGGLARAGSTKGGVDESAKRLWVDVLATGTSQGLAKGRFGELIQGAMGIVGRQATGVGIGDPSSIFNLSAFLGQNSKFSGSAGFSTMGKLDSFAKGESSPMARALSLVNSGVGNVGMAEAMRRSERGLFGDGASEDAVTRVRKMVGQVGGMVGGDRDQASMLLSQIGGFGANEATQLIDLVNSGRFGQKEYEALKETTMSDEQKAYKSMISASGHWANIDKTITRIESVLNNIFDLLGGFKGIETVLRETLDVLKFLKNFISTVQTDGWAAAISGKTKGAAVPLGEGVTMESRYGRDVTAKNAQLLANYQAQYRPELEEARKNKANVGGEEALRVRQDAGGKFHFMFEMRDSTGRTVYAQEIKARSQSGSASTGKGENPLWAPFTATDPVTF